MSGMEAVRYDVADEVATITLSSEDTKNALSAELVGRLADHLDAAMDDDEVRVIVLTNTGSTFCAGADLSAARPGPDEANAGGRTFPDVFEVMQGGPKPVVGRLAGHSVGGGVGLAAACDISIAADDAKFGFTEVRIGVSPAIISVVCLPKLRPADAAELMLTGERIPAARAADVGLINRAVPRADLDAEVSSVVDGLLLGGPAALAATKQLLRRVPGLDRAAAFAWTSELSAELFRSAEAQAGISAFRHRAAPPWAPAPR